MTSCVFASQWPRPRLPFVHQGQLGKLAGRHLAAATGAFASSSRMATVSFGAE